MSVRKRGASWAVAVYDPATQGKRWVGTFATERDAKRAERRALDLSERGARETVAGYAARWLETHPRPRQATMLHYTQQVGPFIEKHGNLRLGNVTRSVARAYAVDHRGQAAALRAMFGDARRDDLIAENPFADLRLQQSRGRRDLEVLTVEEVAALAEVARVKFGPGFAAFVLTAAYCGLRPGELYALTWPSVDFDADEIAVTSSYSSRSGETTAPKNNRHRLIVLFPEAKEALLKVAPPDDGFVFRTMHGAQLTGASLHYYWDPCRTAIGRPSMNTYELRHFAAAHMLNTLGHEAEDVAYQLGHTDGGVLVRKLYGHPSEELARERLKGGFGRKVRPLRAV